MRYDAILKSKKNLFKVTVSLIDDIHQCSHCVQFHTNQSHLQDIETMKHGTATHPQPKAVAINMVWVSRKSAADISQHEAVG